MEYFEYWVQQNGFEADYEEDIFALINRYADWEFGAQGELGL